MKMVKMLEITEVVLIHCKIVNNNYQQNSRVLYIFVYIYLSCIYTFVPNKSFGSLLDILPKHFIFLKTFNSNFSYIEVWFPDQNSNPLKTEDRIN